MMYWTRIIGIITATWAILSIAAGIWVGVTITKNTDTTTTKATKTVSDTESSDRARCMALDTTTYTECDERYPN